MLEHYLKRQNGIIAIESKIPINGIIENNGNCSPRLPAPQKTELINSPTNKIILEFIFKI